MSDPDTDLPGPDGPPAASSQEPPAAADQAELVEQAGLAEHAERPQGMIPGRGRRRSGFERVAMRVLATGGIIGLAVALGAILVAKHVDGWIVGLTIGLTSVTLAAVLWSSRQL